MKVLITGIGGFAGSHLAEYILDGGFAEVAGIVRDVEKSENIRSREKNVQLFEGDIVDFQPIFRVMKEVRPDVVFHLAGQAFVPNSFEHTAETFKVNVIAPINIFEAVKALDISPRIVVVTSGEVYGETAGLPKPHSERSIPHPVNPYAASKTSIDYIAQTYKTHDGLDIVIARPFNHTGPRQKPSFVCSSLARQIAQAMNKHAVPQMQVGNVKPRRDFTDVRDVVRAYWEFGRISNKDEFIFNVCSEHVYSIEEVIGLFEKIAGTKFQLTVDQKRLRGYDIQLLAGSNELLKKSTGWAPRIPMEQTLRDLLEYWREKNKEL